MLISEIWAVMVLNPMKAINPNQVPRLDPQCIKSHNKKCKLKWFINGRVMGCFVLTLLSKVIIPFGGGDKIRPWIRSSICTN